MAKKWKLLHRTLQLKSKWVTVYADKLLDNDNNELEYWHYDRVDSAVVVVIQNGFFVLPEPQYRVGIDQVMLDFPGSRVDKKQTAEQAVKVVLKRELNINEADIKSLEPINREPLAVDSSFSSQKLHGFITHLSPDAALPANAVKYKLTEVDKLRTILRCGQCLLLLDEFLLQNLRSSILKLK